MFRLLVLAIALFSCGITVADTQINWITAELREDGSQIEAIENYNLYHFYENVLQPAIEIDADSVSYVHSDTRIGIHTFEISTVEDGQEGRRSYPVSTYIAPNAKPVQLIITLEQIQ